ncbi:Major facilitator superfamily domain general substrate transporter [Penicillium angulare]|uniref:Major facilitator superfamily domain general substrate transporter n=1 Tax=Penicillium angulare TaxID=116970 RepID=UPI00253FDD25|nr:Major facilitator superfamily domain general substrate transporter [Penicillium angulare]KAJ5257134.1 Major facilitator superfamily domain general substrate transporter [Penicillium angulare]
MEPATDSEKFPNDPKIDTDPSQSDDSSTDAPAINDTEKQPQADLGSEESHRKEERDIGGWKWVVVVLAIYSSQFLFALDQTIVANVQPAIVEQFNAVDRLSWVSVAFLIGAAGTNLERPLHVGGAGLVWDSSATWRWSFYINLCVGAVCAPVYLFMLPNKDPRRGTGLANRARELDYLGTIILLGAFFSGVMAVSFGGVMYSWDSGRIIGLFCCSGVLFILFGVQQAYAIFTTPVHRIFPVEFLKSRIILILFAMTGAGGTAIFLPIYMTPLYFQFSRGDGALQSGVRLLPFIMLMIFATISNGAILFKVGYYMPWYLVGGILVVIGGALMFTVDTATSVSSIYGYTVLIGIGAGLFCQGSFSIGQAIVKPEIVAASIGFISTGQISGTTLALALANAVFLNKSEDGIMAILPNTPIAEIQQTITEARSTLFDNLSADDRQRVMDVIVSALSSTYALVITAGLLVTVLSLLLKRDRLFVTPAAAA